MEHGKSKAQLSTMGLRKLFRAYHEARKAAFNAWVAAGYEPSWPVLPMQPEVLRGLACGATTRAGTPCTRINLYINGRCKLHGGLSTGPTSKAGKKKASLNGLAPKRKQTP